MSTSKRCLMVSLTPPPDGNVFLRLCTVTCYRCVKDNYNNNGYPEYLLMAVFGCNPSGLRCGNSPNELVHRAGPPFLDNYYCGYQYNLLKSLCIHKNHKLAAHIVMLSCSLSINCFTKNGTIEIY